MKIELSHDILARKIYDKASTEDKLILKIENIIHEDYLRYLDRKLLMNTEDYEYIYQFLDAVNISDEEEEFIEKSRKAIDQKKRARNIIIFSIIGVLTLLGGLATFQTYNLSQANAKRELAYLSEQKANREKIEANAQREKAIQEKLALEEKNIQQLKAKNERIEILLAQTRQSALKEKELREQADKHAEEADRLRELAEEALKKAEQNEALAKKNEEVAKKNAEDARKYAAEARKNEKAAREFARQAKKSEQEAIRLRNLADARVQANNAIRLIEEGKLEEGAKLALSAYQLNNNSEGPKYNADCYLALDAAYKAYIDKDLENMDNDEAGPFHGIQKAAVRCIATTYSPSEKKNITAFATEDRHVTIIDDKGHYKIPSPLSDRPRSITFSNNGRLLLVGLFSGQVEAYEYNKKNNKFEKRTIQISNVNGKIDFIKSVSPQKGSHFVTFATPSTLYVGTVQKNPNRGNILTFISKLRIQLNNITATAFSYDGKYALVTNKQEAQIHQINYDRLNIERSKIIAAKSLNNMEVSSAAIGKMNEKYLFALGFENGLLHLANLDSLDCLVSNDGCAYNTPAEHKSSITKLIFSDDGKQMISSSLDRTAKIWNVATLNQYQNTDERIPLLSHKKWIWDVSYTHGQDKIYTVSEDKTVQTWLTDSEYLADKVCEYLISKGLPCK